MLKTGITIAYCVSFYPLDAVLTQYLLSVRVRPSQASIVSERLNMGSQKQCQMIPIAQGL